MASEALSTALAQSNGDAEASPPPATALRLLGSDEALHMIGEALPDHLDAKAFQRHALTLVKQNPKLLECEATSVAQSIVRGAALGLDPDPALGQMWLVARRANILNTATRKKEWCQVATFQVGYRGLYELAMRTGKLARIEVSEVRENDTFEAVRGTGGRLVHDADWFGDRGEIRGWYAFAEQTNGGAVWATMSAAQMAAHRDRYAPRKHDGDKAVYGPWADNYEEMAAKTSFIRVMRWVPKSVEVQQAVGSDDKAFRNPLGSEVSAGDVIDLSLEAGEGPEAETPDPEPVPPVEGNPKDA